MAETLEDVGGGEMGVGRAPVSPRLKPNPGRASLAHRKAEVSHGCCTP
jgi:hypothetical protein